MRPVELEVDRAVRGFAGAADEFRFVEFKSVRHDQSRWNVLSRYAVVNRRTRSLDDAGHLHLRTAGLKIDGQLDLLEQRRQELGDRGRKYLPDQLARLCLAPVRNGLDRRALLFVGSLVNDRLKRAIPLVNSAGPPGEKSPTQALDNNIPKTSFIDLDKSVGAAVTMSGQALELARTAPGAIAVYKFDSLHRPFHEFHRCSFRLCAAEYAESLQQREAKTNAGQPHQQARCGDDEACGVWRAKTTDVER